MQHNESLEVFKRMVEEDIKKLKVNKSKRKNIWKTVKEIEKKKEIVIRPADKGGGLVILNKRDDEMEMNNLLRTQDTYKKLHKNPKTEYEKKPISYIKRAKDKEILTKRKQDFLFLTQQKHWSSIIFQRFIRIKQTIQADQ